MTVARISRGSLASEVRNASAVPWNAPWTLGGRPISSFTLLIRPTACPNEAFGARLKENVTTGNCP